MRERKRTCKALTKLLLRSMETSSKVMAEELWNVVVGCSNSIF